MHAIEFTEDGKAECLHTDVFPLATLGKLSMERASTIEWNEERQQWIVMIDGAEFFASDCRAYCLHMEREHFNGLILER